jgi:hypothetical protein
MIDLEIAIRTCEQAAQPTPGSPLMMNIEEYQRSHQAAAAILRRVQSLDPGERAEIVRDVERVQALELLGMKRRQLRPNMSLIFRHPLDEEFQQVGAIISVTVRPDRPMWPLRLAVDPACGDYYDILQVAAWSEQLLGGPISGRMFPPVPLFDGDWTFENLTRPHAAIQPGMNVTVRAQAVRVPAPPLAGLIYCSALLPGPT